MPQPDSVVAQLLRQIPSMSAILDSAAGRDLIATFGHGVVKLELRRVIDDLRADIRAGAETGVPDAAVVTAVVADRAARLSDPVPRAVINATGILLHTNLGRAPLCAEAVEAMRFASGYTPVEVDRHTGKRSVRGETVERLLREITGAEAALVVNNNAAATMLVLNTVAQGKEVIISRGQLVEIGGSYRMPDVMAKSGAILREIGATNRTHGRDYEAAITATTGAILHVHTSNYRIRGFAGTPDIAELGAIGKKHGVPVLDDLGSGALVPLSRYGQFSEPLVADSLAAGADLVCFSGDKLIGGPQAGIILGRREWIDRVHRNSFTRMMRVDKLTYAGLEATLLHFLNGTFETAIPFYAMMARPVAELAVQAETTAAAWRQSNAVASRFSVTIADDVSFIGSGSIPDEGIGTQVLRLAPLAAAAANLDAPRPDIDQLSRLLRFHTPAVFARIHDGALVFDMRTVLPAHANALIAAVPSAAERMIHRR